MTEQGRFTTWLVEHMQALGMTQAQVARRVGTGDVQVMRWRRGEAIPSPKFLTRLADLFGVDVRELERLAYLLDSKPDVLSEQVDADRRMWRARYDYLMERKVPKPLWTAYLAACEALADAYQHIHPGPLSTPDASPLNIPSGEMKRGATDGGADGLADCSPPFSRRKHFTSLPAFAGA